MRQSTKQYFESKGVVYPKAGKTGIIETNSEPKPGLERNPSEANIQTAVVKEVGVAEATAKAFRPVASLENVHFSSKTSEWATPVEFFDRLDQEFNFTLDVCATADNAKCERFYSPSDDGLKQTWRGTCWLNPPYGDEIGRWVKKAYESSLDGATVVCLLPSRTDTRWWHDYATKGEVRFIKGRLKFGDSKNAAPFPSAVVVFRPKFGGGVLESSLASGVV